jgi:hypothetical protein
MAACGSGGILDTSQVRGAEVSKVTEMSPFSFNTRDSVLASFLLKKFPFCEYLISLLTDPIKWKEYLQKAP